MALTLQEIRGRVIDLDSHEQIPTPLWPEIFGERGRRWLEVNKPFVDLVEQVSGGAVNRITLDHGDRAEITPQTVWELKGTTAPSAANMNRRPEVLDMMGIQRQLVFPTFGLFAFGTALGGGVGTIPESTEEEKAASWQAVDAYNEWAGELTGKYPDRMRIVGVLPTSKPGMDVPALIAETKRLMKMGVRGIFISTGHPPVGLSPADVALDPWYAMLAEANVAICMHAGGGAGYRATDKWQRAPQFFFHYEEGAEFPGEPLGTSSIHIAEENFITVLVIGGVFERHPTLRVGAIEILGHWIGPLAERLDYLAEIQHRTWDGAANLKLRPSEYLARHVRVTPTIFEPVEKYVERYPYLEDVYCYSSDFPHPEGYQYSMQKFYHRLAPHVSDRFLRKFFFTNGQLLVP